MQMFKTITTLLLLFPFLASGADSATIKFDGKDYIFRWAKNTQYEFTPPEQTDLQKWQDMLTVNYYPKIKDGEGLAAVANNLLGIYKKHGAKVLRTASVPRTSNKPAEHLIVVVFGRPAFIEFVQARLKINEGLGSSLVYSHRMYGSNIGGEMGKWIKANGQMLERKLMSLEGIPSAQQLGKLPKN